MDIDISKLVDDMCDAHGVRHQIVLLANRALTACEFVAAGLGVSLVHSLMISGLENRIAVRRFEPDIPYGFQLCRSGDSRNAHLVEAFAQELRATAEQISHSMLGTS